MSDLQAFIIDVVQPAEQDKVQLVSYKVLAYNPDHALERFFKEEAGVVFYEGDVVDRIAVGLERAPDNIVDA